MRAATNTLSEVFESNATYSSDDNALQSLEDDQPIQDVLVDSGHSLDLDATQQAMLNKAYDTVGVNVNYTWLLSLVSRLLSRINHGDKRRADLSIEDHDYGLDRESDGQDPVTADWLLEQERIKRYQYTGV